MKSHKKNKKSLANKANSRMNDEKSQMQCDLLMLDIEHLYLELEEKDAMILQLKDELKLKKVIINQKDVIFAQYEDELKKKDIIIDQQAMEIKQKEEVVIKQQNLVNEKELIIRQNIELLQNKSEDIVQQMFDIEELNQIIKEKELVIKKKEDTIEAKLEIIKIQDHKIAQLINSTEQMYRKIFEIEEGNKRCMSKLESDKRMRNLCSNPSNVKINSTVNEKVSARKFESDENEQNANPNVSLEFLDVPMNQIKSQLLKMMDDDSLNSSIQKSCIEKSSKKSPKSNKNRVSFSENVNVIHV